MIPAIAVGIAVQGIGQVASVVGKKSAKRAQNEASRVYRNAQLKQASLAIEQSEVPLKPATAVSKFPLIIPIAIGAVLLLLLVRR